MLVLFLFSSPTHFLHGSGQRTRMAIAEAWFCAQWPIFVLFLRLVFGLLYSWKIQTESITYWFFICWYLIESMMPCVLIRCPGPPAEIKAHNIKNTAVYLIVHMGYFLSLCSPNPSWVFGAKKLSSDHRSQSHLKFQSCLITENPGVCFWMS